MNDGPKALEEFKRLLAALPEGIGGGVELLLQELLPAGAAMLRLAAVPHQFDLDLLRVLDPALPPEEHQRVYDELADLSIVVDVDDGLAIHDNARAYLLGQWLRPERRRDFAAVSTRLADHFGRLESAATGAAKAAAQRARIFHGIGADPDAGFAAFEELCRTERLHHRLHACEALIRLVHEYDAILSPTQKLRLSFHETKLFLDLRRYDEAEALLLKLQRESAGDLPFRARLLFRMGRLRKAQRRFDEAKAAYGEALAIARSHGEARDQERRLVQNLAALYTDMNELEQAAELFRQAIAMAEAAGDQPQLAECHNNLGKLLLRLSEPDRAIESFRRSLSYLATGEEEFRAAQVYSNLGLAYADQANWEQARQSLEASLEIARKAGDTDGQAMALSTLRRVYLGLQRRGEAITAAERAVELFLEAHNWFGAATALESFASLYRREHRLPEARAALIQAAAYFRRAGDEARAARCKEAAERPERRGRLPWYAVVPLVLVGLFFLLLIIAMVFGS